MAAMGSFEVLSAHTETAVLPPVMVSLISCTTPDEPGLILSTRRGLEELACAFSTTVPDTAASRMTLLVTLSSALRE